VKLNGQTSIIPDNSSAATNSPPGMVLDMESLCTSSPAPTAGQTTKRIVSGAAPSATSAETTPARSSRLSADEEMKLAKIRRNRQQGWMPTFEEFDFLLEILERINR